jgi:hypothetical protein
MDFGGFYLFGVLGLVVLAYGMRVAILARRSPIGRRNLTILLGGIVSLFMLGRFLYQAYWLDEEAERTGISRNGMDSVDHHNLV